MLRGGKPLSHSIQSNHIPTSKIYQNSSALLLLFSCLFRVDNVLLKTTLYTRHGHWAHIANQCPLH